MSKKETATKDNGQLNSAKISKENKDSTAVSRLHESLPHTTTKNNQ